MVIQVLNVDDYADNRELRSHILRNRGYEVIEAGSGAAAVSAAVRNCPEVVLLDVNLPDLSGIEVCRQIKAHPPCEHTVVILISATELGSATVLEGFAAGADMYLRDQLEPPVLAAFVDAAVRRRQTVVELQHDSSHAQLELGETLRRYRSMFDCAPYGIYHVLGDGTILDANRAFLELVGCASVSEAQATNMYRLYSEPQVRDQLLASWRTRGTGRDEVEWRLANGRRLDVSLWGRVLDLNADVFEVFVEDITERKRLEADFHHRRKMEAIGRLAGGVAHDLNNWLTVIVGYAELMLDEAADQGMRDGLQEILSASRSATGITRNLLTFSRKQVVRLQTVDLNHVVTEFHQLVERILGEQIAVEVDVDGAAGELPMRADPTQIQQVLMNLAVNARDAMPRGGRLTVRTGRAHLQEGSLGGAPVAAGAYAMVMVEDTGVGMTAEVRERLFEPFFTTKESGKGTGLGMAVVYGIVKQLGGYITVDSEPGAGTVFTMYFPLTAADAPAVLRAAPAAAAAPAERTRVLLVEDEEPVRLLTKRILERAGYDVVAAADGEEALQIFGRADHPIGLVLTDVVMPGMSGPELLARILRARDVPALLMSGYPDQGEVFATSSPFRMIAKPFTAEVLTGAVRATLDRASL